jgi:hypothetical protein
MKGLLKGDIVKHYKGGLYRYIGEALHTETNETLTAYSCMKTGQLFIRPLYMFHGENENGEPRFVIYKSYNPDHVLRGD